MTTTAAPTLHYHEETFEFIDDFTHSRPLLGSKSLGWNGLEALVYTMDPVKDQSIIPELTTPNDIIIVHLEGIQKLKRRFEGRWVESMTFPGQLTLNPKDAPMLFHWSESSTTIGMSFTPAFMTNILQEIGQGDPMHVELIPQFNEVDPLIVQIGHALLGEMQSSGLGGRLYAEMLGQSLAVHALRNYANIARLREAPKGKLSSAALQRVKAYIEAHLSENIGIAELAACAGFSAPYFTEQFKRTTGYAPHQYLLRVRVERALELLNTSRLTVAEVAQRVGFYDQSHLIRHFKRIVGVSPHEVRKARNVQ
ncbi:MAG: AraC family transcriptional regulator [Chloroflexota bacterium]